MQYRCSSTSSHSPRSRPPLAVAARPQQGQSRCLDFSGGQDLELDRDWGGGLEMEERN